MFDKIGRERGNPSVTPERYRAQTTDLGALVVGSPETVATKTLRHSQALGGIDRFTFQMDGDWSHVQLGDTVDWGRGTGKGNWIGLWWSRRR